MAIKIWYSNINNKNILNIRFWVFSGWYGILPLNKDYQTENLKYKDSEGDCWVYWIYSKYKEYDKNFVIHKIFISSKEGKKGSTLHRRCSQIGDGGRGGHVFFL
jgi:hypothetical protein